MKRPVGRRSGGGSGPVFGRFMFCHDLVLVLAEHRHHSMNHLMGRLWMAALLARI